MLIRAAVAAVLLLVSGYAALVYSLMWMTIRPLRRSLTRSPAEYGFRFEVITFRSADGTVIRGWYVPAAGDRPKGTVILCHGIGGNRQSMLGDTPFLRQHGFACLLFDFRSRGESDGAVCTLGWRETDDLLSAVGWVRARRELSNRPIGVLGVSLGAATAIRAAARCKDIQALAVEAPFSRLDRAVALHFKSVGGSMGSLFAQPVQWAGERRLGFDARKVAPVDDIAALAPRPLLLIVDENDELFPHEETDAVYNAARYPKQRWIVPGAGHAGAGYVDYDGYARRVGAFFEAALK